MSIQTCHACGQAVPADQTHCPACGKPQILRNKYRITGTLSDSTLVQMYMAQDLQNNRPCVVKLITTTQVALRQIGSDLKALATHARRLPFVPDIYDLWFSDGQLGVASEYIEGPTLTELTAHGPRSAAEVEEVFRTVLGHLDVLHPIGLLHRDIKPDNIKRTADGRFVLVNFGLSRDETLTGNNAKAYLLPYLAPEQIYGEPASPRSDLYGIAATAYHLLTGQAPPPSIARVVSKKTLIPPDQLIRNVPINLQIAIMQMMELDPARRPVTPSAALAILSDKGSALSAPRRPSQPAPPPVVERREAPAPAPAARPGSDGLTIPLPPPAVSPTESASSWTLKAPVQRKRYIPPWVKAAAGGGAALLVAVIGFMMYTRTASQQERERRLTALAVQEIQRPTLTAAAVARQERGTATALEQTALPQQTATAWADQQLSAAAALRDQAGSATPTLRPPAELDWADFKTERYPQSGITLAHDPDWRVRPLPPLPQAQLVEAPDDGSEGILAVSGIQTGANLDLSAAVEYVSQFLAKPGTTPQVSVSGDANRSSGTVVMTRLVAGYDVEIKGWVQVVAAGNAARVVIAFVPLDTYDANQPVLEQAVTTVIFP